MSKDFKRHDSHKKKSYPSSWRKPRGRHSRMRLEKKGAPKKVKIGYRTPKKIRGKHPSGYEEVLVYNTSDLEDINPDEEAVRIASKVGERKRETIVEKAEELEIKVFNPGEN